MLRHAFRLQRWGTIGFGFVFALPPVIQASAYYQVAGNTAASRAAFAHSMEALASVLSLLLPHPHRLDTLGGYVQWRAYGGVALVAAVWAVAAATSAVRGDEEKQLVDSWLAAGISRTRLVFSRMSGFGLAALVATAAAALGVVAAAARAEPGSMGSVPAQSLALWALMLALFSLCYLVAQVPASLRGAQLSAAALLLILYLLEAASRSQSSLDAVAWLSPFHWYSASYAVAPGGHLDAPAVALSLALAVACGGLSALAFRRRDVRGPLFAAAWRERRARDLPPSPALSWAVARELYRLRWTVLAWMLTGAAVSGFLVALSKSAVDSLINLPSMRAFLTDNLGGDPYRDFVGAFAFGIGQLLVAGFAVHLVASWSADDTQGILAAELSRPRHRWAVVLERAALALAGTALVVALATLAIAVAAAGVGITLEASRLMAASGTLVPFALTFAAVGAVGSARWPRAVVGVLGILALLSYLLADVGPLLGWPAWVINLSVFQLYGAPLISGVNWNGLWALFGITMAGFGLAALLMQRREVSA